MERELGCVECSLTGAIIIPDPIATYYNSLNGKESGLDRLTVATDTISVWSIFALVETSRKEECILDSGCQVIAMSKDTYHRLGITYNPSIKLNMQSANGDTDKSLRLAHWWVCMTSSLGNQLPEQLQPPSPHYSFNFAFLINSDILQLFYTSTCTQTITESFMQHTEPRKAYLIIPSHKIAHFRTMMDIKLYLDKSSGASQNKANSWLFPYSYIHS